MDPINNPPHSLPAVTPHIAVSTAPVTVRPQQQVLDHTGVSTYFAIRREFEAQHNVSTADDLKFSKVSGKFSKDNGDVIADTYNQDGKAYFKFDVTWTAVAGESPNEKSVSFQQTIFTSIKVPSGTNPQEYENAKQKAYQVAKSYELIQKNLVKPENPRENYNDQINIIKSQNKLLFAKDTTSGISDRGHEVITYKAMAEGGHPVLYTAIKTNEQGILLVEYAKKMANQSVVLKGNESVSRERFLPRSHDADTPLANFERLERSQSTDPVPDNMREGFTAHLKDRIQKYDRTFKQDQIHVKNGIEHANNSLNLAINGSYPDLQSLRQRYFDISPPNTPEKMSEKGALEVQIKNMLEIPTLEANLQGLIDQKNKLENAYAKELTLEGYMNPIPMAKTHVLDYENKIAEVQAGLEQLTNAAFNRTPSQLEIRQERLSSSRSGEITMEEGVQEDVLAAPTEIHLEEIVEKDPSLLSKAKSTARDIRDGISTLFKTKPKSEEIELEAIETPIYNPSIELSEIEQKLVNAALNAPPSNPPPVFKSDEEASASPSPFTTNAPKSSEDVAGPPTDLPPELPPTYKE